MGQICAIERQFCAIEGEYMLWKASGCCRRQIYVVEREYGAVGGDVCHVR